MSSSPTGTRDYQGHNQANIATRQRTYPKPEPLNEQEFLLASNSNPNAPTSAPAVSPTRSILNDIAIQLNLEENREELVRSWNKFTRKKIGVIASLRALGLSSWLNILLLLIPLSWVSRFLKWSDTATFTLSFFAIIPLERLFDYGGEQMSYYLGKELGNLLMITLNNSVEATLAIILLQKCQLQLLKATIVGVIILHLLLVPGTAFVTGGARIIQQDLHPHATELNHSLLTLGVLSLLLPAAFFAALDTDFAPPGTTAGTFSNISDETRGSILKMSRGIAVLLLLVYLCSRLYLHNPPGKSDELTKQVMAPLLYSEKKDPEVNQWVCLAMLIICIAIMAVTAEWLVESIEFVREVADIKEEWFGLILLPFVSFAADGFLAVTYFIRYMFRHFFREPAPPNTLAKAEAIDLSIQFVLFWMPFFTLLAWWTQKPLTLLFDIYEVAVIIGSCFIVNYVTADSKTNWAEGISMIAFYIMIALCAWFYPGQPELKYFSQCESVALALTEPVSSLEELAARL